MLLKTLNNKYRKTIFIQGFLLKTFRNYKNNYDENSIC